MISDKIGNTPVFLPSDDEQEYSALDTELLAPPVLKTDDSTQTPPEQMAQQVTSCPPAPSPSPKRKLPLSVVLDKGTEAQTEPGSNGDTAAQREVQMDSSSTVLAPSQHAGPAGPSDRESRDQNPFPFVTAPVVPENPHPSQAKGASSWLGDERSSEADVQSVSAVVAVQSSSGKSPIEPGNRNGHKRSLKDAVGDALSNLYNPNEGQPWNKKREELFAKAREAAAAVAEDKANAAKTMPPPPPPGSGLTSRYNSLDPRTVKDMIIDDKLKDMYAKATIVTNEQQRLGAYAGGWPRNSMTFFDGFNNTWFLPREDTVPSAVSVTGLNRQYQTSDEQLNHILQHGGEVVQRAYRWIERETQEFCSHEWQRSITYGNNSGGMLAPMQPPALPRSWDEARVSLTVNDMAGMICRTRLLMGKVCFPGYITINVVVGLQGRLIATPHYMPPNVDLAALVGKLNSWDPPNSTRVSILFQTIHLELSELEQLRPEYRYAHRKAADMKAELREPRFQLDVSGSERRLWSYKAWNNGQFVMPVGKVPSEEGWTVIRGAADVGRIKDIARRGQLVVLIRPWELRARSIMAKCNALMQDAKMGRKEPKFSKEQLKIVDAVIAEVPGDSADQARELGRILKEQREI